MAEEKKGEVKLLGSPYSPFVLRVKIALNIKSVDYEFIRETANPKSELLLKSNPVHKKIPVLFHNDNIICESLVIVQYIDEVWSSLPSLLPSDPYDRAMQRFWASYIDDKWFWSMFKAVMTEKEEAKAIALEQVKEGLAFLEDYISKLGKPFFSGDQIGYLDIVFGSLLGWFKATEIKTNVTLLDEAKTPGLFAWANKFWANDVVKNDMPDPNELVEFSKILPNLQLDMLSKIKDD